MPRINYTQRRRITLSRIDLLVKDSEDGPVLDVGRVDLSDMSLPADADIVVEAYRRASYMRLDAGTVAEPNLPYNVRLTEFDSADTPRFRIKVIGKDGDSGKLLAAADRLRASAEGEDEEPDCSLLAIEPADLGKQIWKIDCSEDDPKILVNKAIGDWRSFVLDPTVQALILPEVFRQVIIWALDRLDGSSDTEDPTVSSWVEFMRSLGRDPSDIIDATAGETSEWVDDIVDHFCSRHRLINLISDATGGREG